MVPPMGSRMYQFQQKMKEFKARIRTWRKEYFGNIFHDKKILISQLEEIQTREMNEGYEDDLKQQEIYPLSQLASRERHEEIYWKQKSRNQWLQEGECNTKFFHNMVIQNRQRSKIHKLWNTDRRHVETKANIEEELVNQFK